MAAEKKSKKSGKNSKKAKPQENLFRSFIQRLSFLGLILATTLLIFALMGGTEKDLVAVKTSVFDSASANISQSSEPVSWTTEKRAMDSDRESTFQTVSNESNTDSSYDSNGSDSGSYGSDSETESGTDSGSYGSDSGTESGTDSGSYGSDSGTGSGTDSGSYGSDSGIKAGTDTGSYGSDSGTTSNYDSGSTYAPGTASASYGAGSAAGTAAAVPSDTASAQPFTQNPLASGNASPESRWNMHANTRITGPDGRPRCGEILIKEERPNSFKNPTGPAVSSFLELFNFDITPDWIEANWSCISLVGPLTTRGYRVPVCTGPAASDLVGSLTYYFNPHLELEKITFEGYTGELDRLLISLKAFHMSKRTTSDPNALLYISEALSNNQRSFLRTYFRLIPTDETNPHKRYWITMELYPPEH